jgi:DNA-binding transcriptional MerR regulator
MLIGEVSERSGVSSRMLRHYDALGLVAPSARTVGGYRDYSVADLERLVQVEGLRTLGMSLAEIRRALDGPAVAPDVLIGDLVAQTRRRIEQEQELLGRLQSIDVTRPLDWAAVLRTVRLLRDLGSEHAAMRQRAALSVGAQVHAPTALLVEALLAESDTNVAGALRWALAMRSDSVLALGPGLSRDDPEVRRRAVLALAAIPGAESAALLLDALDDADPQVRRHAALTLGARGRNEAVPVLIDLVETGSRDVEAAGLLGSLAEDDRVGARVIHAFLGILDDVRSQPGARHRVAQALGELHGSDVEAMLQGLTGDDDPAVARTARALLAMRV